MRVCQRCAAHSQRVYRCDARIPVPSTAYQARMQMRIAHAKTGHRIATGRMRYRHTGQRVARR
eukprot:2374402-Rhodomonas_salina.1